MKLGAYKIYQEWGLLYSVNIQKKRGFQFTKYRFHEGHFMHQIHNSNSFEWVRLFGSVHQFGFQTFTHNSSLLVLLCCYFHKRWSHLHFIIHASKQLRCLREISFLFPFKLHFKSNSIFITPSPFSTYLLQGLTLSCPYPDLLLFFLIMTMSLFLPSLKTCHLNLQWAQ